MKKRTPTLHFSRYIKQYILWRIFERFHGITWSSPFSGIRYWDGLRLGFRLGFLISSWVDHAGWMSEGSSQGTATEQVVARCVSIPFPVEINITWYIFDNIFLGVIYKRHLPNCVIHWHLSLETPAQWAPDVFNLNKKVQSWNLFFYLIRCKTS